MCVITKIPREIGRLTALAILITGTALGLALAVASGMQHSASPPAMFVGACAVIGIVMAFAKMCGHILGHVLLFIGALMLGLIFAPFIFNR